MMPATRYQRFTASMRRTRQPVVGFGLPAATLEAKNESPGTPDAAPQSGKGFTKMGVSTMFRPATRKKLKLRMAICGPAKSGKTFNAIQFALAMAGGGKVAVVDTEHGAASKYSGIAPGGTPWKFDVCELSHFAPSACTAVIREAVAAGYSVVVLDSLSHYWAGVGGALDQVDRKSAAGGNSFTAWRDVTPQHNELIEAILSAPLHVIATMRVKTEYVLEEETNRAGKKVIVPKKVGMKPVQRDGMDYEFDMVCDIDPDTHTLVVGGTRCSAIDGQRVVKPGPEFMTPVLRWLDEGETAGVDPGPVFQPAAHSENPIPSLPAQTTPAKCSDIQRQTILDMSTALEMSAGTMAGILGKRGVTEVADLTTDQAAEIIANLRKLSDKKKAELDKKIVETEKAAKDASKEAAKAAGEAATSGKANSNPAPGMAVSASRTTIDEIVTLCGHLKLDAVAQKAIIQKRECLLFGQKRPCQTWAELTKDQAETVHANLLKKFHEAHPDDIPF